MDINHAVVDTVVTFTPVTDRGAAWMRTNYFAHFDNGVVRFALNIDGEKAEANRFISRAINDGQDLGGLTVF
jgi:hypothetical protein